MTTADINAIPDDKWTNTYGGCSRPAGALLADAITMMSWTTDTLKGEKSNAYDDMGALAGKLGDKAAAVAALAEASQALGAAINGASDELLNSTVEAPWGMPTPVYMLAQIAVSHIWYHDGQLNYIQCMLGDDKVHWMA
jgi:hypothetical protein